MAATDNPLKRLFTFAIDDLAPWLLSQQITHITSLNAELPEDSVTTDQVYHVVTASNTRFLWYLEFQGRGEHTPMPFRILEYMVRLYKKYHLPVRSVVLYIDGAGKNDSGQHSLSIDTYGMTWHYDVIHLYKLPAATLLKAPTPAPLSLLGLTALDKDKSIAKHQVSHALDRLMQEPDNEQVKATLVSVFTSLMPDKELTEMIKEVIDKQDNEWWLERPFAQMIREEALQEGREEGRQEGRQEGKQEGRQEGRAEGQVEGVHNALSQTILQWSLTRLEPSARDYLELEKMLKHITNPNTLQKLIGVVFAADSMTALMQAAQHEVTLANGTPPPSPPT